jgi:hypothetical protein
MDQVVTNFSNAEWWVSVVVFGALVSVLGGFLKDWAESGFAKFSASVRLRIEVRGAQRNARLDVLKSEKQEQLITLGEATYFRLRAAVYLLMSTLMIIVIFSAGGLFNRYFEFTMRALSVLPVFWAIFDILAAQKLKGLVDEARRVSV